MRTSFIAATVLAGLGLTTAQSTLSSLHFDTSGLEGQSATASFLPSSAESSSASSSGPAFTTHGPISLTITPTTSPSSTSGSTSAASSASATRNAQVKLQAGKQEVVGVVGLMAGVLAVIV